MSLPAIAVLRLTPHELAAVCLTLSRADVLRLFEPREQHIMHDVVAKCLEASKPTCSASADVWVGCEEGFPLFDQRAITNNPSETGVPTP